MELSIYIPKYNGEILKVDMMRNYKVLPSKMAIYKFYNEKEELLYIGKTIRLQTRMREHFSGNTNMSSILDEVEIIRYFFVNSNVDLDIYETYLINKEKPKYNSEKVFWVKDEKMKNKEIEHNKKLEKLKVEKEQKAKIRYENYKKLEESRIEFFKQREESRNAPKELKQMEVEAGEKNISNTKSTYSYKEIPEKILIDFIQDFKTEHGECNEQALESIYFVWDIINDLSRQLNVQWK